MLSGKIVEQTVPCEFCPHGKLISQTENFLAIYIFIFVSELVIKKKKMNTSLHRQLFCVSKRVLAPPQLQTLCRACSTNLVQTSLEDKQMERFIPMTRRTLLRKLTENTHLVAPAEKDQYMEFVKGLESSISQQFHESLTELKVCSNKLYYSYFTRKLCLCQLNQVSTFNTYSLKFQI